jgi:4-carboxymuconolactone decarboxylase
VTTSEEMHKRGDAVRREVLGDAHVDRSSKDVSEFSRPMQELVTSYCWGEAWGDERLPRRTRSLLNIAMMVALDRQHELALHLKGALNNGCTVAEIQATLLQSLIYCGVPAGMEGFRTADAVLKEAGAYEEEDRGEGPAAGERL